jgi:hypothetical protein
MITAPRMADASSHPRLAHDQSSWSNRVLLLSLAGIFFLTLYPFRFEHQQSARFLFPLSLNGWGKGIDALDVFLNVLLFIPFGFGLAEKLRERGKSKAGTLITVYICGALVSYLVELLQIYIPGRDSGWIDVATNSSGALIGAWFFEAAGAAIIAWFAARERALDSWLTLPRIGVLVSLYIGFWCVVVKPLQKQVNLSTWTPDSFLAIGDSASLNPGPAWMGRIFELDVWDRAIPANLARKLTSEDSAATQAFGSLSAYRFSGKAPVDDEQHFLPSLDWASRSTSSASATAGGTALNGHSWLISAGPVPTLVSSIQGSGQFGLRLVCQPAEIKGVDARIVSIASPSGAVNLEVKQYNSALAFWFRNRLSMRRSRMTWFVPHVFESNAPRNLLLSFDGAAVSLYINGRDSGYSYDFGPGIALAHYIRNVKSTELTGYGYVLYAIIFAPAGCLLGFAWRRFDVRLIWRLIFLVAGFFLPALAIEWVLADAVGRSISLQHICFSAALAFAGCLWLNADRSFSGALRHECETASVR